MARLLAGFLKYFSALLLILLYVAASINISKEQAGAFSRILVFLFKYVFGFPVGFSLIIRH